MDPTSWEPVGLASARQLEDATEVALTDEVQARRNHDRFGSYDTAGLSEDALEELQSVAKKDGGR